MCSATEFNGVIRVNGHHPNSITIFLSEQCHGTQLNGFFLGHFADYNRNILANPGIDNCCHSLDLFIGHLCEMREIKTHTL